MKGEDEGDFVIADCFWIQAKGPGGRNMEEEAHCHPNEIISKAAEEGEGVCVCVCV